MRLGTWLFLILISSVTNLQANEALQNFLQDLQTFQAHFEQTLYSEDKELLEESSGEVYIQRPNQFRWVYEQPYEQLIVADGKQVWIYDYDLEQVTVKTLNDALGKTPAVLLSNENAEVEKNFSIEPINNESKYTFIALTPKEETSFKSIRLSLDGKQLRGFELIDNLGQRTYMRFSNAQRNPSLKNDLFEFEPPEGVDVIRDVP